MAVVEAQAGAVFHSCFQLLSRVSEVDSMVRVLHLVTVMLEALGPKAQPHFAAITAALPQVSSDTLMTAVQAESVLGAQPKVKTSICSATSDQGWAQLLHTSCGHVFDWL